MIWSLKKILVLQSHCEHHMAPIVGVAHVAYIPLQESSGFKQASKGC